MDLKTASGDFESDSSKVKLIVKSSNQQYDDQIIECDMDWSIGKLKQHLSVIYPSKPNTTDQKLIYGGKLLTDKLLLNEILRIYEDVENTNHIFHLVYTPKNQQQQQNQRISSQNSKNVSTSQQSPIQQLSDGLRHRNVNNSNNSNNSNQPNGNNSQANIPLQANTYATSCPPNIPLNFAAYPGAPAFSNNNLMAQQMAMQSWMQQTYLQYMNQYMNMMSNGASPNNFFTQNAVPSAVTQMPPFQSDQAQQNLIGGNQNQGILGGQSLPQNSSSSASSQIPLANQINSAVEQQSHSQTLQQQQPQQQPPQAPEAAPPRFPQIVQDDQQQENRDWLDNFYAFSRLLVLLTLVYFYSSPLRCLVVLFIGIGFYLFHIGMFRTQGQNPQQNAAIPVNRNGNNDNNNNAQQQNDGQQQEEGQNNEPSVENRNVNENSEDTPESSNLIPEAQSDGQNVLALLRTFVVTFFTSLLPEPPAL